MRIAVDLDGVVYEFQRTFRYMMREYRGIEMPPVEEFWFAWDSQKQYGTEEDHAWMWSEGVAQGLFRYGHMWQGARIGLQALHDAGHELLVVTHRPESAVTDTLDWVAYHFRDIPLVGCDILSGGQPKTSVKWDAIVDDKPENVVEALASNRRGLLFNQPWNQKYHIVASERVYGWKGVVDAASRRGRA